MQRIPFVVLALVACTPSALVRVNVAPAFEVDGCQRLRQAATQAGYTVDVPEGVDGWDVAAGRSDCANVLVGEGRRLLFWQLVAGDTVRVEIVASADQDVAQLLACGEQLLAEVVTAPTPEGDRWLEVPEPVGDVGDAQIHKLAVREVVASDLPDSMKTALTDLIVTEGAKVSGLTLTTPSEVGAILGLERQKELLGCDDDVACMAEITGALGVDGLLVAGVGRVGETYMVTFKVIDTGRNAAALRLTAKARGEPEVLIELFETALPRLLRPLVSSP